MANFDFKNAQLPQLLPLKNSFTQNEVEAEVKQLTLDLFAASLAEDVFDVNVLGAAHLGSFELVRRSINSDGLVLLQGDREEDATRYLFRAWKSRNNQGRGLHFLRTYLQLLFPNICNVYQCWQDKKVQYPTSLHENIPQGRDKNDFFLTSRVEISLTLDVQIQSLKGLRDIIRSVVPARIVPGFRFIIIFELAVKPYVDYFFDMDKVFDIPLYSNCLYVSDSPEYQFIIDDSNPKLLSAGMVGKTLDCTKESDIYLAKVTRVDQLDLAVDGTWNVSDYGSYICEGEIVVS